MRERFYYSFCRIGIVLTYHSICIQFWDCWNFINCRLKWYCTSILVTGRMIPSTPSQYPLSSIVQIHLKYSKHMCMGLFLSQSIRWIFGEASLRSTSWGSYQSAWWYFWCRAAVPLSSFRVFSLYWLVPLLSHHFLLCFILVPHRLLSTFHWVYYFYYLSKLPFRS
jgi:hypothetical protein